MSSSKTPEVTDVTLLYLLQDVMFMNAMCFDRLKYNQPLVTAEVNHHSNSTDACIRIASITRYQDRQHKLSSCLKAQNKYL